MLFCCLDSLLARHCGKGRCAILALEHLDHVFRNECVAIPTLKWPFVYRQDVVGDGKVLEAVHPEIGEDPEGWLVHPLRQGVVLVAVLDEAILVVDMRLDVCN